MLIKIYLIINILIFLNIIIAYLVGVKFPPESFELSPLSFLFITINNSLFLATLAMQIFFIGKFAAFFPIKEENKIYKNLIIIKALEVVIILITNTGSLFFEIPRIYFMSPFFLFSSFIQIILCISLLIKRNK